jgi:hypothetical protein
VKRVHGACLLAVSSVALAASWDWRAYNFQGSKAYLLDAANIRELAGGKVRVWTEEIDSAKTLATKAPSEAVEKRLKALIANGYTPPMARLMGLKDPAKESDLQVIGVAVLAETLAETGETTILSKTLWEVDCKEQRIHVLAVINADGSQNTVPGGSPWNFIVPETAGDSLAKIVCNPSEYIQPKPAGP